MKSILYNWTFEFSIDDPYLIPCDFIHFKRGEDIVGYLSLRYSDGPLLKMLQFGYYCDSSNGWICPHSPAFEFRSGNYRIECYTECSTSPESVTGLIIRIFIDGVNVTYFKVPFQNPTNEEYELELVIDKWNDICNIEFNSKDIIHNSLEFSYYDCVLLKLANRQAGGLE